MKLLGTFMLVVAIVALAACTPGWASAAAGPEDAKELVRNPTFAAEGQGGLPAEWAVWKPVWENAAVAFRRTDSGLCAGAQEPYAVGGVWQDLAGIKAGQAYAVKAECELTGVKRPAGAVLVRMMWMKGKQQAHPAGMLVRLKASDDAKLQRIVFEDCLIAPPEASGARLSLEVKWPEGGTVLWKRVSVQPCDSPPPRKVKIGTVYLRPKNSTPEKNLDLWTAKIDEAGKLGLDIVCLGETITMVGTQKNVADVAEAIPGPTTERLGAAARKNHLWVVAGLMERVGDRLYNTAVLMDRDGRLAGKYRKVHLPREEWQKGITPGDAYPVFKTDFGTVGIQVCYDWFFSEAAEIFALHGAEILLAPTWGDTQPDADGRAQGETVFRTRARDNGLYLVPCVYDGHSMVIDPMGRILASNAGAEGVFWAEVDLSKRECLPWVGEWRQIGWRDRMPGTYAPLLSDPSRQGP